MVFVLQKRKFGNNKWVNVFKHPNEELVKHQNIKEVEKDPGMYEFRIIEEGRGLK